MSREDSHIAIGTVGFDGPAARTFSKLDAVELPDTFRGVPGPKLLRRLRRQAPEGFAFSVQVPLVITQPELGARRRPRLSYLPEDVPWPEAPFDTGPAGQAAWRWICAVAERISARALLLQTSAHFRPTAHNRGRMRRFLQEVAADPPAPLAWDAQGLWSVEEHLGLCRDLGLVPVLDPLLTPVPPAERAYLRVLGRARSPHGLSADDLDLLDAARDRLSWGLVLLATPRAFRDASALQRLGEPNAA